MNVIAIELETITEEDIVKIKNLTVNIKDIHFILAYPTERNILVKNGFRVINNFEDYWNREKGYFNIRGAIFPKEKEKRHRDYGRAKKNNIPIRVI